MARPLAVARVAGLVLGSALFFPVSCTTATFVGMNLLSKVGARNVAKGEMPHDPFHVLVHRPAESADVSVLELYEVDELERSGESFTFLMKRREGVIREDEWGWYTYSVERSDGDRQEIEVFFSGDDVDATSRYLAERAKIWPLYSRILRPGHMFGALPYALGFALVLWLTGKLLLRRVRAAQARQKSKQ